MTPEQIAKLRSAVDLFRWGRMTVQVSEVRALLDRIEELEDADNCCCGVCGV